MLVEVIDRNLVRWQPETDLLIGILRQAFVDAAGPPPEEPKRWSKSAHCRRKQKEAYESQMAEWHDAAAFFVDGRADTIARWIGIPEEELDDMVQRAFSAVGTAPELFLEAA